MSDGRNAAETPASPLWHQWVLFGFLWGGILLVMGTLNLAAYGVYQSGQLRNLFAAPMYAPLLGLFIVPSAVTAALLRGLVLRLAPADVRVRVWPAVVLGAVAAPLGLLVLASVDDLLSWRAPDAGLLGALAVPLPMMLINGAVAGLLAHQQRSPRDARWWGWLTLSVAAGLLAAWGLAGVLSAR